VSGLPPAAAAAGPRVRRARIEEIRPLAEAYAREAAAEAPDGQPYDAPLPQGGIFWIAEDVDGSPIGYTAGTLRPTGCVVGPVYIVSAARRRGVGEALILAVQHWAGNTRVPVVEISVAADNTTGQSFLEALGYRPRRILMNRPALAAGATT
jgi:GNAT superfamily N-acetyltransferase